MGEDLPTKTSRADPAMRGKFLQAAEGWGGERISARVRGGDSGCRSRSHWSRRARETARFDNAFTAIRDLQAAHRPIPERMREDSQDDGDSEGSSGKIGQPHFGQISVTIRGALRGCVRASQRGYPVDGPPIPRELPTWPFT